MKGTSNRLVIKGWKNTVDPRRTAILLIGGDKTGNDRWYKEFVPIADALYDQHVEELKK